MSALPQGLNATRLRGSALWLVPVVALALVVGWETDWGRQIVRVPSTPGPVEPKPMVAAALPDYQIEGGLPAHSETVQRTLFNATRRPAPVATADDGARQVARGAFQLMGTSVTAERNVAFLKEISTGKTRVVRQGDDINGMKVALVAPDRVQFKAGDDSEDLILKVAAGPKTTLAAAPGLPGSVGAPGAAAAARAAQASRPQPVAVNPAPQVQQPPQPQTTRASRRAARQGALDADTPGTTDGTGGARAGRRR